MSQIEDLEIFIQQTALNKELAKKILLKNNGDVVKSIIDVESCENPSDLLKLEEEYNEENDINEAEVEVNLKKESLENYRDIVDSKDEIYNVIKEEKEKKKRKEKENEEKLARGEKIEEETPLNNEEVYYSSKKKNFTSVKVL